MNCICPGGWMNCLGHKCLACRQAEKNDEPYPCDPEDD